MNFDSPVFRIGSCFYLLLIISTTLTASGQNSVPRFESDDCAVPTMVVTSEYDAYTPPAWVQAVAKNLKKQFSFRDTVRHGPAFSTPCLSEMINEFGDDPKSSPNSDCLEKLKSNKKFVTEVPKS
jgi:TAP-like protein